MHAIIQSRFYISFVLKIKFFFVCGYYDSKFFPRVVAGAFIVISVFGCVAYIMLSWHIWQSAFFGWEKELTQKLQHDTT